MIDEAEASAEEDVSINVTKDRLTISANRPDKRYHEELVLPAEVDPSKYTWSYGNDVLVVRLEKLLRSCSEGSPHCQLPANRPTRILPFTGSDLGNSPFCL